MAKASAASAGGHEVHNSPTNTSTELFDLLNEQVATWSVMYTKLHNYHWYVKGQNFFTLHVKFEELYTEATLHMDTIAERLLTLGGHPVATLREQLEKAVVEEARGDETDTEMVRQTADDFGLILASLKKGMRAAAEAGDDMTEDILNAVYQSVEKHQWMLNAFGGGTQAVSAERR